MTRRRVAIALALLGALVIAGAAASWLAIRVWGPVLTSDRIAAAVADATGRAVRVEGVILEPLRGRVRVQGITVAGAVERGGEPMLRVERVDASIRIESVWRRELVVAIAARGVDLRVEPEPSTSRPFVFEMPERFQLGPVSARIASMRIEQGRLRYEDPASDLALELVGLAAEGRPDRGGLELTARADTLHLRLPGVRESLERLAAEGRVDAARILVRRLDLGGEGREIRVTGAVETPWSHPILAAEAKARLELGALARSLSSPGPVAGEAVLEVTLAGPVASPLVAGRLRVPRLTVRGVEARELSAAFRWDEHGLTIPDLSGRLLGGRLDGSLAIPSGNPRGAVARARLADADLAAMARVAGAPAGARGRIELEAEARGDLSRPASLQGHLRVEGSELSLPGELGRLGPGRLTALARMSAGQVISDIDGRWPSATLGANVRLDADHRLRLQARGAANLAALAGWALADTADVQVRGEGHWPQMVFIAGLDLSGPTWRRGTERVDVRLDPVPGSEPRWSGSIRARRLSLPWGDVDNLQGAFGLSAEALEVARIDARVAGVPAQGSGRWSWSGGGALDLTAGPVALARLPGVDPDLALEGSGRVEIHAKVGAAGVQASARVQAGRVAVARIPLGDGEGQATLRGRSLEAALRFPARQLEVVARGDLTSGQVVRARLSLRSLDLEPLVGTPATGGTPLVRGTVSAEADLAVAVDAPHHLRGSLRLEPRSLVLAGMAWHSAGPLVVRIDGQRATLEPARLTGPAGVVTAHGVVWDSSSPPLVQARLEQGRLAMLAPTLGLDGLVRIDAELSGGANAVAGTRARARISGDGIELPGALAGLGKGQARAELVLAEGAVSLPRGEVAWPGLTGGVTGRIGPEGQLALDVRATAEAERLGLALGRSDLAGAVTATATVGGRLGQPDARGRIASGRLSVSGVVFEGIDASARLQGHTIHLERLTGRVLGSPLRAHGEWTPGGAGRGELEAGPLALSQIQGLPERFAPGGSLSLHVEAAAERTAVKALARARVTQAQVAGLALGAGRLTARLEGKRLSADLELAERRIRGSAAGTLEPGGAIEATLEFGPLELGSLIRRLAADQNLDVEATASGRITARLPWDRPSGLTARARFEPILVSSRGAGLEGRGRAEGRFENDVLRLERAELSGSLGQAQASGTLDTGGRVDLQIEARLPLRVLLAPVTGIGGSEGTVVVQGQVTGGLAAPILRGEATLSGGRVAVQGIAEPLRDISARMVAIPGTVRLVEATAALGSGRLQATGDAALPGGVLGAYRLRLTARDLPLRPLEGLATVWNADLELTGLESRALLSGDARLVRGSFSRDLVALSAVMTSPPAAGAPRGALPLRIRVMLDDNLVVRTPQARARVGGTLSLQGTTAAPIVLGVLEAREGTVILRGSRYQLERAVIRFADPRRIDPLLDIVATTRIGEYDVTVRVTGHVRDLDISLSSSPPLPRNDLMSLVAFGTTTTSGGAGGVLAGEAARLLANELFDLSGTDSALPEPVRNVMDRTRVSYTHNSEDLGRFGFRVEHEIGGPFLVTAERTSQGYFIIDGVVRLRFR